MWRVTSNTFDGTPALRERVHASEAHPDLRVILELQHPRADQTITTALTTRVALGIVAPYCRCRHDDTSLRSSLT